MSPALPGILAAVLYIIGVVGQLQALRQQRQPSRVRTFGIVAPAVVLHAVSLALVMQRPSGIDFGFFAIAALVAWFMIVTVLVAGLWQRLENFLIVILPLGTLALLGALAFPGPVLPRETFGGGLFVHVLTALAAYTTLAMAATQSIAISLQERMLRHKQTVALLRLLPPLLTMERLLFQLVWAGFVLLTLAVASGFTFLEDMLAQHVAHHTVLSTVAWGVFLMLLLGHHVLGWRGTTATRWTITGFVFLVLAYFGSKFVLEIILS